MTCWWHKWTRWSDPEKYIIPDDAPLGSVVGYKQTRKCEKCNASQIRRL